MDQRSLDGTEGRAHVVSLENPWKEEATSALGLKDERKFVKEFQVFLRWLWYLENALGQERDGERSTERLFQWPKWKPPKFFGGRGRRWRLPRVAARYPADGSRGEGRVQPDAKVPGIAAEFGKTEQQAGETLWFWTRQMDGAPQ